MGETIGTVGTEWTHLEQVPNPYLDILADIVDQNDRILKMLEAMGQPTWQLTTS